jgi:hypothetical protein
MIGAGYYRGGNDVLPPGSEGGVITPPLDPGITLWLAGSALGVIEGPDGAQYPQGAPHELSVHREGQERGGSGGET